MNIVRRVAQAFQPASGAGFPAGEWRRLSGLRVAQAFQPASGAGFPACEWRRLSSLRSSARCRCHVFRLVQCFPLALASADEWLKGSTNDGRCGRISQERIVGGHFHPARIATGDQRDRADPVHPVNPVKNASAGAVKPDGRKSSSRVLWSQPGPAGSTRRRDVGGTWRGAGDPFLQLPLAPALIPQPFALIPRPGVGVRLLTSAATAHRAALIPRHSSLVTAPPARG